jgi:uroporphyrinogen-III synthase
MQNNNITILSTGLLDKEILEEAFDIGVIVEIVPFIATRPIPDKELQKIVEPLMHRFAFIIVTSQNAVEALAANLKGVTPDWRFFCIGGGTSKLVRKYFGSSSVAATADNARELDREIYQYGVQDELIFFCGDQRRDELPDQLRERGIWIKEVVIYETMLTPQQLTRNYEAILFFSPSAVKSFFSVNKVQPETVLFAIGSTTAEALNTYTTNKIIIADKPGKEELVDKAIKYFKQ